MRSTPFLYLLAALIAMPMVSHAQEDEDDELGGIDNIVVTITKRDESLNEVAATVSAFDAKAIQQVDIQSISDVVNLIPNVQIKGDDNGGVSIRGVSQSFTSQAPVSMHMNGVWRFSSGNSLLGAFYDLESIQVQRGPVGTVYGRNATAGAIDVSWKKPHDDYEVDVDATVGNNSLYLMRGTVNIPFFGEGDERLMGRFSFQRETRDNYNELVNRTSNDGGVDAWYLRGSLRSVLTEDLQITVRGSFAKDREAQASQARPIRSNGAFAEGVFDLAALGVHPFDPYNGYQNFLTSFANSPPGGFNTILTDLVFAAPGFTGTREDAAAIVVTQGNSGFGVPPIIPALDRNLPLGVGGSRRQGSNSSQDHADAGARTSLIDAEVLWSLNDLPLLGDVQVKAIGGWDRWRMTQLPEADGTQLVILDTRSFQQRKSWVGEINISSQNDDPIEWLAGFFYFDSEHQTMNGTLTPFGLPPLLLSTTNNNSKGWAPFGQVNVRPLEYFLDDPLEVELWAGIRYNHDEQETKTSNPSPALLLPGRSPRAGGESIFREVTYEFGLRVFPIEGHMVYAKWSKGYKPGFLEAIFDRGTSSGNPNVFINSVDPEVIRAWEFGWKSEWWDGRLQAQLTYFRYSYSDLQVPKITASVVQTENAASASNQGAEIELRIQPTEAWSIQFAGGWLDATFDEFCSNDELNFGPGDAACANPLLGGPGFLDLKDNNLEDSPHYKVGLVTSYQIDLGDLGTLTPVASVTWTGDYFRRGFNRNDYDRVDSFSRTDLRLIWESVDERYSMELFVQNLEDKLIYARTIAVELPTAAVEFGLLPPRVFGVRFGYHWGGN